MDDEVCARIFEPFFTTKPKGIGTGLGLATVHGIVKQSGGHISVSSKPGHGTTFSLEFPSACATAPAPTREDEPALAEPAGSCSVLVVEDDPEVRAFLRRPANCPS
jgi:hypothetical protein